jgi:predicted nuclease of restriction endonuclease-like (RecB) superfamily
VRSTKLRSSKKEEEGFSEIVHLIAASREKALQAVNTALIGLYWEVGGIISRKIAAAEWGDAVVNRLAASLAKTEPGLRGFTRRNLFRMRQFYDAYRDDPIVSPLVAQLPWSHHLIILGQSRRREEHEFYVRLAIRERWSKRLLSIRFTRIISAKSYSATASSRAHCCKRKLRTSAGIPAERYELN